MILAISGSLQRASSNGRLLDIARDIDPAVTRYDGLAEIPAFNPDDDDPAPEPVEALRGLLRASDGVLIATPEYAFGLPGALKNALDWMVGSGDFYGKRAAIVSGAPAPERGQHARADLERTLRAQGSEVRWSATVAMKQDADAIRAAVIDALDALTRE